MPYCPVVLKLGPAHDVRYTCGIAVPLASRTGTWFSTIVSPLSLKYVESPGCVLRKLRISSIPPSANPGAASTIELQAQLDDARQQLDTAEREKTVLAEKMQAVQERSSQLEDEKKRRTIAHGKVGVHGTILVVNQAYNFVVLNLGGRNGVEPHSDMLIVRDGTFIGKIHISSVEPTTAIGDIITSTLARGVQVQPGDTVIYAGSNS